MAYSTHAAYNARWRAEWDAASQGDGENYRALLERHLQHQADKAATAKKKRGQLLLLTKEQK